MKAAEKRKAVFLDRDGVINRETNDYIRNPEEFVLNEGVIAALKKFRDHNYLLIVITNQRGITRGFYSEETLERIHKKMTDELAAHQIFLDEIYYCPHHPPVSNCLCRKPKSLMVEKAIARFNIDTENSVFIGDKERDIEAGNGAGVKGILIKPNERIDLLDL